MLLGFTTCFKLRAVSRIAKVKIYEPVVMYRHETWSMIEERVILNMWERNILTNVHGPVAEHGVWRNRINQQLRELYKTSYLGVDIKRKKLKWLGHVIGMN
jgi:hypothetical protein